MAHELILIPKQKYEKLLTNCSKDEIKNIDTNKSTKIIDAKNETKETNGFSKTTKSKAQIGEGINDKNESHVKMTPKEFLTNNGDMSKQENRMKITKTFSKVNDHQQQKNQRTNSAKSKWLSFKI